MDLSGVRIVIPHRGLRDGKARLADVLTPDERVLLNGLMLDRVARAARAVVPDVVLISPDAGLADRAAELGLSFRHQSGGTGMNHALEQATADALAEGVRTLAVISADLPQITAADVEALVGKAGPGAEPSVTIAPDGAARGTNALVLRPPGAIPLRFGIGSRAAHAQEARERVIPIFVIDRPAFAQDIDERADLDAWVRRPSTQAWSAWSSPCDGARDPVRLEPASGGSSSP